jgi:hypothetical protein
MKAALLAGVAKITLPSRPETGEPAARRLQQGKDKVKVKMMG